jgi:hypothetical protein
MNKKTSKKLDLFIYLLIVAIIITITIYVSTNDVFDNNTSSQKKFVKNVKVTISTPTWSSEYISVNTSNITVAELLFEFIEKQNITINKTYWPGYNSYFITQIGNYSNGDDNRYWQYYVNEKYANVGCSKYVLNNNDTVEWTFEKSNWD